MGITVIALGGNAIASRSRTFDSQYRIISSATKQIASLAKDGYRIVITHGNGPQVGDALLRQEAAAKIVPQLPLHACVAETQGLLGFMIQSALMNYLKNTSKHRKVVTVVTTVSVSSKDPAFENPTKPIGPYHTKKELTELGLDKETVSVREIQPGKYRRVVPSTDPQFIVEANAVKKLAEEGYIVIAAGGGGIPFSINKVNSFVEAVVDKDLASERLASSVGASRFVSLTDVEGVYLDYRSSDRQLLRRIKAAEIRKLMKRGEFEEGSIKPKVMAAMRFAENTGRSAIIAKLSNVRKSIEGKSGTVIYR